MIVSQSEGIWPPSPDLLLTWVGGYKQSHNSWVTQVVAVELNEYLLLLLLFVLLQTYSHLVSLEQQKQQQQLLSQVQFTFPFNIILGVDHLLGQFHLNFDTERTSTVVVVSKQTNQPSNLSSLSSNVVKSSFVFSVFCYLATNFKLVFRRIVLSCLYLAASSSTSAVGISHEIQQQSNPTPPTYNFRRVFFVVCKVWKKIEKKNIENHLTLKF